jgi:hypothetical protein
MQLTVGERELRPCTSKPYAGHAYRSLFRGTAETTTEVKVAVVSKTAMGSMRRKSDEFEAEVAASPISQLVGQLYGTRNWRRDFGYCALLHRVHVLLSRGSSQADTANGYGKPVHRRRGV